MGRVTIQGTDGTYAPAPLMESKKAEDGYPCECREWCEEEECCDACPIQDAFDKLGMIEDAYEEYNSIIRKTGLEEMGERKRNELTKRLAEKVRAILES